MLRLFFTEQSFLIHNTSLIISCVKYILLRRTVDVFRRGECVSCNNSIIVTIIVGRDNCRCFYALQLLNLEKVITDSVFLLQNTNTNTGIRYLENYFFSKLRKRHFSIFNFISMVIINFKVLDTVLIFNII